MCDAILVLGGGVREGGELPPWVVRRFDRALELSSTAPIVCLSAATVHRPSPLNPEGYPILESVAGAAHLLARGVSAERIQVEASSYDTIGNAYFSKLLHVDPAGWRSLAIVTSEFHMPRSRAIFDWIFGMEPGKYQLRFEAAPNDGLSERSSAAQAREGNVGYPISPARDATHSRSALAPSLDPHPAQSLHCGRLDKSPRVRA